MVMLSRNELGEVRRSASEDAVDNSRVSSEVKRRAAIGRQSNGFDSLVHGITRWSRRAKAAVSTCLKPQLSALISCT